MSKDKSELKIAKHLNGRITNGSGCVADDADIKIPGFLIECKRRDTIGDKIVFYPKYWEKLRKQSVKLNRDPLYVWVTHGNYYCITYLDTLLSLNDKIKHREVINKQKSNVIIKTEDFINCFNETLKSTPTPVLTFNYQNINFGIIDLNHFKNIIQ